MVLKKKDSKKKNIFMEEIFFQRSFKRLLDNLNEIENENENKKISSTMGCPSDYLYIATWACAKKTPETQIIKWTFEKTSVLHSDWYFRFLDLSHAIGTVQINHKNNLFAFHEKAMHLTPITLCLLIKY